MTILREERSLSWPFGVVRVEDLGGMLGPTLFNLPGGKQVAPFQVAPWADEPGGDDLPGILRRLRGEWPCVPFGSDADRAPHGGWPGSHAVGTVDPAPHGFGSNNFWHFEELEGAIALAIDYPEGHPVRGLRRTVTPDPDGAALDFTLEINIRRDCTLPIGLHPTFRLPEAAGSMRIEVGSEVAGMTFPAPVDDSSIFSQGALLEPWHDVPLKAGGRLDMRQLPLGKPTEELLQLLDMSGYASLWNTAEGYRVRLTWNPDHFPSTLLWISNRGRSFAPWNSRHLALGFEPICSAFDLGQQVSSATNPISHRGIATARRFTADEHFMTRYRIEVEAAGIL